jgi:hypothetical protein
MNKKLVWLLTVVLSASVHLAEAQQPEKIPRVGFLSPAASQDSFVEIFRQELKKLGYKNATSAIPIVMTSSTDPVGLGFVNSLAIQAETLRD